MPDPGNPQGKGKQERFNLTVEAFLDEIALKTPESLEKLNTLFSAWLNECYLTVEHSALGTTPEIAFKSDSMPPRFIDSAVLARAFLHCEQRKADKSGCISFRGEKYDLGVRFAGRKADIVYDESSTDSLTVYTSWSWESMSRPDRSVRRLKRFRRTIPVCLMRLPTGMKTGR